MATKKSYTIGTGDTLTDVKTIKGSTQTCVIGKLHIPGMRRALSVTFNVLTGDLILHEWYLLTDEQYKSIAAMLTEFFADYATTLA